jgi:predicted acyl esterase
LDRITVPAYVVASYSHTLHTEGTFRAWRRIASDEKWLRIHASLEWPDYYDSANVEDLRRFFDHYLKGEDNGWEQTPRVRFPVLDLEGGDRTGLTAGQFPPDGVTDTKYYLDGRTRSLSPEVAPAAAIRRTTPRRSLDRCRSRCASTRKRRWSATSRRTCGWRPRTRTTPTCSSWSRS